MARLKQTKRQNAEQARASSTPAPPPTTSANENTTNETDENVPIISKVEGVPPDPTKILEPREIVVAIVNGNVAQPTTPTPPAKRKSRKRKDGRLPYLPAYELNGFIRDVRVHVKQLGPPRKWLYCLDCLRTHMIIWCDGTREEVEKTCAFHEKKNNGRLNVQYYDRIREMLATDFSRRGVFNSRRFTKPILKHKKGCEHKDRGSMEYWDERVVEDLAIVEAAEDKHLEGT